jgi:hypothetical protein
MITRIPCTGYGTVERREKKPRNESFTQSQILYRHKFKRDILYPRISPFFILQEINTQDCANKQEDYQGCHFMKGTLFFH